MSRKIVKTKSNIEGLISEKIAEVSENKYVEWKDNSQLKIVGKPVPRIDGYDKVSGSAIYTFDKEFPRMLFAKTLRSPHPHAKIKKINLDKAKALAGVADIIYYKNVSEIPWYYGTGRLFDLQLRYEGDEIACVAAETEKIAEAACKLIEVEYELLPFEIDPGKSMLPDAYKVLEWGNVGRPELYERGNIENGFKEADVVFEDTFSTSVVVHNPAEVHCSVVNWDGDKLTVYDSTQAIFNVRDAVASALNISQSKVRVIKKFMGGGFGSKLEAGKYTVMAALLAKSTGRPVKIVLDRKEQNLAVGNRPDSVQKLKIGLKNEGTITAMQHYSYGSMGAYATGAGCAMPLKTIYKCPNVKTEELSVLTNAGRARAFRAPGHVQGTFALESFIDEAAEKIGMDPLEFRLKNYSGNDQEYNIPYTSKLLKECYLKGAEKVEWNKNRKPVGSSAGTTKKGMGVATQIWWGGGEPPAFATLKLNGDGSVDVISGTQELGGGTYTILAQVAAEVLEIPIEKINVILGDTADCPYAPLSGGSMTAPSVSPAVRDAAEQMKQKLISYAAVILQSKESELVYKEGKVFKSGDESKVKTIAEIIGESSEQVLVTQGARNKNPDGYMINTFGAQFAEVEVDTETGKVKVTKIVAAHDIGRVLNRQTLENQFHGGIIQGMSYALMEERIMDRNLGKVLNTNFNTYKVPTILDIPEIEVIIVSEGDSLISNTGVKGVGEPAIIPTAGAIANAIYNAIGVRIKSLPITPDKILTALSKIN